MKYLRIEVISSLFLLIISSVTITVGQIIESDKTIKKSNIVFSSTDVVNYFATESIELLPSISIPAGTNFEAKILANTNNEGIITSKLNAILTQEISKAGVNNISSISALGVEELKEKYMYMDGLDRPRQSVFKQASNDKKDVVQIYDYDQFGRNGKSYLPYVGNFNNGVMVSNPIGEMYNFYNVANKQAHTAYPFSEVKYDNSPLNRVVESGNVGEDWQLSKSNTTEITTNSSIGENIRLWKINGSGVYYSDGYYEGQRLTKTSHINEDNSVVVEYRDNANQTIMQKDALGGETYYLYDDMNRLGMVLSPEAILELKNNTSLTWTLNDTDFLDRWAFTYKYDGKNRIIEKKSPGSGTVSFIYDNLNRLIFSQDAKARLSNEWLFIKYDNLKRPVMSGVYAGCSSCNNAADMQTMVNNWEKTINNSTIYNFEVKKANTTNGYSNRSLPTDYIESNVLNIYYYDNYDFDANAISDISYENMKLGSAEPISDNRIMTLPTATKSRILKDIKWMWSVNIYDKYARIIQSRKNNIFNTAINDSYTFVYDNNSRLEKSIVKQKTTTSNNITNGVEVTERYAYNHLNTPITLYRKINNEPENKITGFTYNQLGQLKEKDIYSLSNASSLLQSIDYAYNERGWLTSINKADLSNDGNLNNDDNDLFGMELFYNKPINWSSQVNPKFNGTISAIKWKSNDVDNNYQPKKVRSYSFLYDASDRLTLANYAASSNNGMTWADELKAYNCEHSYDMNGNITAIQRFSMLNSNAVPLAIDNLAYDYVSNNKKSNLLRKVTDGTGNVLGFSDRTSSSADYSYDANGNILTDYNKFISSNIVYNYFNMPEKVVTPSLKLLYNYDASGNKLKSQILNASNGTISESNYIGNFTYDKNGVLNYFISEEARIKNSSSGFKYEYLIKDHLGNTRIVFQENNANAKVLQEEHYYPFGLKMVGVINNTPIPSDKVIELYNGKPLEENTGLYDFAARMYDPAIGRWMSQDPMSERYYNLSPYNFVFNNPNNWNDPDGKCPDCPTEKVKEGDTYSSFYGNAEYINGEWAIIGDAAEVTAPSKSSYNWGDMFNSNDGDANDPFEYAYYFALQEKEMQRQAIFNAQTQYAKQNAADARNNADVHMDNNSTKDYGEITLKTAGIMNDVAALPYEVKEKGIINSSKLLKSATGVSTTGKQVLRLTPWIGAALVTVDNVLDISQNGLQTTNVIDGLMYGTVIGLGITVGALPAAALGIGYGAYQLYDVYHDKASTNYINNNFNINGY